MRPSTHHSIHKSHRSNCNSSSAATSKNSKAGNRWTRYWFVIVPAILFNVVITIDHVVARHQEKVFTATLRSDEFTTLTQDKDLSETMRSHWITPNEEGNLDGRISSIDPNLSQTIPIQFLDVTLLQRGQKIKTSVTDNDGQFVLESVEPGIYTLLASGQNGFLAYGVHVLPRIGADDLDEIPLENLQLDEEMDLPGDDAAAPPELDAQTLLRNMKRHAYYVTYHNIPQDAIVNEQLQIDAAAVPPDFSVLEAISQNYLPDAGSMAITADSDDAQAIAKAEEIDGGFQFPLTEDGNLVGHIQPIATKDGEPAKLSEMNIFLIQDDVEKNRVAADRDGKFEIENVDPGVYSLVAAGKDGFAAMSLELVAAESGDSILEGLGETDGGGNFYTATSRKKRKAKTSVGIAIVSDPLDIQVCKQEAKRVAALNRAMKAQPLAQQPQPFNPINQQQPAFVQSSGGAAAGFGGGGFGGGGFGGGAFYGGGVPYGSGYPTSFGATPNSVAGPSGFNRGGPLLSRRARRTVGALLLAFAIAEIADDNDSPTPTNPDFQSPNE